MPTVRLVCQVRLQSLLWFVVPSRLPPIWTTGDAGPGEREGLLPTCFGIFFRRFPSSLALLATCRGFEKWPTRRKVVPCTEEDDEARVG